VRGRRIAFDYGDVRIGVAVCDPDGILSSPLPALKSQDGALQDLIKELIDEYEPIKFYIGLPINMSGTQGESAQKAKAFADSLAENFRIEVCLVDERLSTVSAQRQLKDAGLSSRESKDFIDSMAAVAILEQGLLSES
jgi:putative Holliday junction resolvase